MVTPEPRYVSPKEFVEQIGGRINLDTVYREIAAGRLPAVRVSKRKFLIPVDALDRMLEASSDHVGQS